MRGKTISTVVMGKTAITSSNSNNSDSSVHRNVDVSSVSFEVHRTLTDINRRKRNVVVCGLPESSCNSSNQGCKRLGKLTDNNHKPRRLLDHLTSEQNVSSLLSDGRNLRRSDEPYIAQLVFINPDMSPTEAKLAFEKRAKNGLSVRH